MGLGCDAVEGSGRDEVEKKEWRVACLVAAHSVMA